MKLFSVIFERHPMVWFLLGLLFASAGLYLGFDNSLSFVYMMVGAFCCAYGAALFVFRFRERPRSSATRLSPQFISAGANVGLPPEPATDDAKTAELTPAED